jgi:hypothetical protein
VARSSGAPVKRMTVLFASVARWSVGTVLQWPGDALDVNGFIGGPLEHII